MAFKFTFDNRNYMLEPFITVWDCEVSMLDPNSYPVGQPPAYGNIFTGVISQGGTKLNLKDAFRETWSRCYNAGEYVDTNYSACISIMCDNVDKSLYYKYTYNPLNKSKLEVYLYYPSGFQSQTFNFDYNKDQTEAEEIECTFYCIENRIKNAPSIKYSGTSWFALGALRGTYLYQGTSVTQYRPEVYETPVETTVVSLQAKGLNEILGVDTRLWSVPDGNIQMAYNRANQWAYKDDVSPYPSGPINACDFFYADYDTILINNENIDDIINAQDFPEDDYTDPTNWNDDFNDTSDYIPDSKLPTVSALSLNFIHAYYLTNANGLSLSRYLLTDDFITNVKKLFANPIDYIMGLTLLPFIPSNLVTDNIYIGGVDTEITAKRLTKQYQKIYAGKVECKELWKGFPDYSPLTHVSIFIPFCGIQRLNVDDVMNGVIKLYYNVDMCSGEFVAELLCDTARKLNGVVYRYKGVMGLDSPITSANYSQKIASLVQGVGGLITGGLSAAGGNPNAGLGNAIKGGASILEGSLMKPQIDRSGSLSGGAGILGGFTPYLIIERPQQAMPPDHLYSKLYGFSSIHGGKLSEFHGYTEISEIDLSGLSCTEQEKQEIINDLKGGVFL